MSLTETDKASIKDFWCKISPSSDAIGTGALIRMLVVYPQTRVYFGHWDDLSHGSENVRVQAKKIMSGLALAVANIDDLTAGLAELSKEHSTVIKVDPANFKFINHCIHVELCTMYSNDYTPEAHVAFDKFLCAVAAALSDKYR